MKNQLSHTSLINTSAYTLALNDVLATPAGRFVLAGLLEAYGIRQSCFDPDPHLHAFRSGMQNAGLMLEDLIATRASAHYLTLLQETPNYAQEV